MLKKAKQNSDVLALSIAALLLSTSFFSPQFSISELTATEKNWRLNETEMHFVWFLPD